MVVISVSILVSVNCNPDDNKSRENPEVKCQHGQSDSVIIHLTLSPAHKSEQNFLLYKHFKSHPPLGKRAKNHALTCLCKRFE